MIWECVCWGVLGLGLGGMWHGRRAYSRALDTLEDANAAYEAALAMGRRSIVALDEIAPPRSGPSESTH